MDDIEAICASSYRNFHVRGFDYLCLSRTPELTRKVYFFPDSFMESSEVVSPHDHRYPFSTTILSGVVRNKLYAPADEGVPMVRHEYMTPLNGGSGFSTPDATPTTMSMFLRMSYRRGSRYEMRATDVHTIEIMGRDTIIMIDQHADVVPLDAPTSMWTLADTPPPSLECLYDRMTPDHARMRISMFLDAVSGR